MQYLYLEMMRQICFDASSLSALLSSIQNCDCIQILSVFDRASNRSLISWRVICSISILWGSNIYSFYRSFVIIMIQFNSCENEDILSFGLNYVGFVTFEFFGYIWKYVQCAEIQSLLYDIKRMDVSIISHFDHYRSISSFISIMITRVYVNYCNSVD